jgi:hypothetical protein
MYQLLLPSILSHLGFYRENLLGSSESLLESDRTATDKLHKQATSSSFGSDEESSNDDQV